MSKTTKKGIESGRCAYLGAWALAAFYVGFLSTAQAADEGPIHIDPDDWKPSAHYIEDTDRTARLAPQEKPAQEKILLGKNQNILNKNAALSPQQAIRSNAPDMHMPVLPGVNQGFSVAIDSTAQDAPLAVTPPQATETDPRLADANWLPPSSLHNEQTQDPMLNDLNAPLKVRMTFLPAALPVPPKVDPPSSLKLGRIEMKQNLSAEAEKRADAKKKTPAEASACAALDAYKKQQLDAIQGDRRTLKALQDAISGLGLSKQLNFSAGTGSISSAEQTPPANAQQLKTSLR